MDGTYYPHPPYSPDLALSDYHLFRHLSHFLRGQNFKDRKDVESALKRFFGSKTAEFYSAGDRNWHFEGQRQGQTRPLLLEVAISLNSLN
ncbi:hypothetical protein WR25_11530 [Diploscapter pachys]|uniref:Histone-lysine N-methyltransferase SETMAR n=1 Tax=Diploscapter pachys TaxID=2018661 RepID=A0A2A2JK65_9BILA|nr:hypothetical protein WR25_11530 [Diploscapter pachys]